MPLFLQLAKQAQEAAAKVRRDDLLADLKARGIIKDRSPEEEQKLMDDRAARENESAPWALIIAVIVGVLAVMAAMGGGVVWFILWYYKDEI